MGNSRRTRQEFRLSFEKEVVFKRDVLNIIVGPTASGKASLICFLLIRSAIYHENYVDINFDGTTGGNVL